MKVMKTLIGTAMMAFLLLLVNPTDGFSQRVGELTAKTKVSSSMKLLGKYHMVITFLESKDIYKESRSREEFVEIHMQGFDSGVRPQYMIDYVNRAYNYHTKNFTPDQVYDAEDGAAFATVVNELSKRIEPGSTRTQMDVLVASDGKYNGGDGPVKRIRWLNFIRKLIDLIDDTFG